MKRLTEKLLLYKIQSHHDPEAFAHIYDAYADAIYRFVLLKLSNHEEAQDVTAEIFLRTWQQLTAEGKNETVRNIRALLYRIARNRVIDTYRRRAARQECSIDQIHTLTDDDDTQNRVELRQEYGRLLASVKSLKTEYQEVITLRFIDELSIKEIAAVLNKKQTAVRVMLHRALKKLEHVHAEALPDTRSASAIKFPQSPAPSYERDQKTIETDRERSEARAGSGVESAE